MEARTTNDPKRGERERRVAAILEISRAWRPVPGRETLCGEDDLYDATTGLPA